jgi:hypothetical protein
MPISLLSEARALSIIFKYRGSKIFKGRYVLGNITTPSSGKIGIVLGKLFNIFYLLQLK